MITIVLLCRSHCKPVLITLDYVRVRKKRTEKRERRKMKKKSHITHQKEIPIDDFAAPGGDFKYIAFLD